MYIHNSGVFNEAPGGWVYVVQQPSTKGMTVRHSTGSCWSQTSNQEGMTMNKAEALAMLREVQEANEGASKALKQARVSAAAEGKAAERDWVRSMQEETPNDGFFVMNTDRVIN
jgi:hypothetical protein